MANSQVQHLNGIDLELLDGYAVAMRSAGSGLCRARLRHRWEGAFSVEGSAAELEAGGDVAPRSHHVMRTDWPEPFSRDSGPTPGLEQLLAAAAACAATTCAVKASARGIPLEALEVDSAGGVDLRGLFELADVHPGLAFVELELRIRSPADDTELAELAAIVRATSPVLNTLCSGTDVKLSVRRLGAHGSRESR